MMTFAEFDRAYRQDETRLTELLGTVLSEACEFGRRCSDELREIGWCYADELLDHLQRMAFSEGLWDGLSEQIEDLPFVRMTEDARDMIFIDLRHGGGES